MPPKVPTNPDVWGSSTCSVAHPASHQQDWQVKKGQSHKNCVPKGPAYHNPPQLALQQIDVQAAVKPFKDPGPCVCKYDTNIGAH